MRLMPSSLALRSSRDRRQQGPDGQNLIEPLGSNCIQEGQPHETQRRFAAPLVRNRVPTIFTPGTAIAPLRCPRDHTLRLLRLMEFIRR